MPVLCLEGTLQSANDTIKTPQIHKMNVDHMIARITNPQVFQNLICTTGMSNQAR